MIFGVFSGFGVAVFGFRDYILFRSEKYTAFGGIFQGYLSKNDR
jgi:hypothetical protein